MSFFTAKSRNPFAERRRAQAAADAAEPAPESSPEPPAPKPVQMATLYSTSTSPEHTETPDIATLATGGIVTPEQVDDALSERVPEIEAEIEAQAFVAVPVISPETQAKIDAVVNRAVQPVVEAEPTTAAEFIATISDPGPAPSVEPQSPPEDEPKRGRGRPRPQETIDRDNAVHALLTAADADEGVSKEALALALDEKEQQVYSSLRQLTKEGRAETRYVKPHGYRWFAV